jgi:hypothetical protein
MGGLAGCSGAGLADVTSLELTAQPGRGVVGLALPVYRLSVPILVERDG